MNERPADEVDYEQPANAKALWELLRQGREQFELREMIRLGFWNANQSEPHMAEAFIERRTQLQKELIELTRKNAPFESREKLLAEIHRKRKQQAKQRRKETRERHERERQDRAARWREIQTRDITYLGQGVSAGLNNKISNRQRLHALGLPFFETIEELAQTMKMPVGRLRFLAYQRTLSRINHYRTFFMPKKSGGKRKISAPMPRLKNAQEWILRHILDWVKPHPAAHGFVTGRSIATNAKHHVSAGFVINMDLKDFFPSVTYKRIKGLFRGLGYAENIATLLALICSESDVEKIEMDQQTWFLRRGERWLPQGAPTSPAITNILCRRLDARMQAMAAKLGVVYTRYADDMTFSGAEQMAHAIPKLLWRARRIIEAEGFTLHPNKLRIMRKGARQEVTGLVVNEQLSVRRDALKRFRALLFQIEKDGPEGKHWNHGPNLLASIRGYAHYVYMVHPDKGAPLVERVDKILQQHGYRHVIRHPAKACIMPEDEVAQDKPEASLTREKSEKNRKPWWKFW